MDILDFLNSKDIAKYLKDINYAFMPEQAAYIIYASRKLNVMQKQSAWEEIIENYPDAMLKPRRSDVPEMPYGEFLQRYIGIQNGLIKECKAGNGIYTYKYLSKDDGYWIDGRGYYDTFDNCLKAVKEEFDDGELLKIRITKSRFNVKYGGAIQLDITPDGEIFDVSASCLSDEKYELINYFDWCWVDIPTPFKRGDVLKVLREPYDVEIDESERLLVLTHIVNWDSKKLKENGYKDGKYKCNEFDFAWQDRHIGYLSEDGDVSDMNAYGYGITEDGQVFCDGFNTYLDLEYYRGELNYKTGILKAISSFEKGDIDTELLINSCMIFRQQEALKRVSNCLDLYTDEGKKSAGLL